MAKLFNVSPVNNSSSEEWREVKGFSTYEVSNLGNVRRKSDKFEYKQYTSDKGYKFIPMTNDSGERKCMKVHRLVASAFIPNPENKPIIDHISRVRDDNRVENLRWATYKENVENSPSSKSSGTMKDKVINVYYDNNVLKASYKTVKECAEKEGMRYRTILECIRNEYYNSNKYKGYYIKKEIDPNYQEKVSTKTDWKGIEIVMADVNNKYLKTYKNIFEASDDTGFHYGVIRNNIVGRTKIASKGDIRRLFYKKEDWGKGNLKNYTLSDSAVDRKVAQIDKNTGHIIKIWNTIAEAMRGLDIKNRCIGECCTYYETGVGRYKTIGGFIWNYMD